MSTWGFLYCLGGIALAMCVAGFGSYFWEFRSEPPDPFDEITGRLGDVRAASGDITRAYSDSEGGTR